jgi:hypothetical protein
MATGRIDSERNRALAGVAQPTQAAPAEINAKDAAAIAAARPAFYREFEKLIDIAGRRASAAAAGSPHQCIVDFVMPLISDPTVFQGSRSISILERLAADILPHLDESEELRSLAGAVIADEIVRHRELLMRLHSGIAA